jgi:hypothetical protein
MMESALTTLRRLRTWFVVWLVASSVVGVAVAAQVIDTMRRYPPLRGVLAGVSTEFTVLAGTLGCAVVLLLGLLVMASLLEFRPWARLLLLVVAWVTVVGAAAGLVAMPASTSLVPWVTGIRGRSWELLTAADVATKVADITFWGWTIRALQFNPAVRAAFLGPVGGS